MVGSYLSIVAELRHEIDKIKGSRFIATATPVEGSEQALQRVEALRVEFSDARHTAWAWRLGADGRGQRCSDDGEPAGSAGRPIGRELEGRDLSGLLVCVTRYFGGTKLGVGGLMRAYGGAARAVLERAELRRVVLTTLVRVEYPYECSSAVEAVLAAAELEGLRAEYTERVRLELHVPQVGLQAFLCELTERTGGRATASLEAWDEREGGRSAGPERAPGPGGC